MHVNAGTYAVLTPDLASVMRVDVYGAAGADVKDGRVLPLVENKPARGAGQTYGTPTFTIAADKVTRNWPVVAIDAETLRIAAILANPRRQALLTAALNTDDAGIINYINSNVTDLASARTMLANLALLILGVIRQ